ncbi:MAG: hypothetical protein AB8G96_04385 [Phycisphaerales bacterium]
MATAAPSPPIESATPAWSWPRRILVMLWIAVRLVVLILLGAAGQKFFYEGF